MRLSSVHSAFAARPSFICHRDTWSLLGPGCEQCSCGPRAPRMALSSYSGCMPRSEIAGLAPASCFSWEGGIGGQRKRVADAFGGCCERVQSRAPRPTAASALVSLSLTRRERRNRLLLLWHVSSSFSASSLQRRHLQGVQHSLEMIRELLNLVSGARGGAARRQTPGRLWRPQRGSGARLKRGR